MNDQPESHNKKIHFDHLGHLYDEPKFYMSELEFLEQKIEAKLEKINEQLSALFQLATKCLRDNLDFQIEIDNNSQRFEMISLDVNALIIRIKDLEDKAQNE